MAAALAGCGASVTVRVAATRAGTGTVSVTVVFDRAATQEIEDLHAGLPVADLRAAGWSVSGPRTGPDGSTTVGARHAYSSFSQLGVLMADIAGSGPAADRPFRLALREVPGTLRDNFTATGTVDLACSLACFDDAALGQAVGHPLGLAPAQITELLGRRPGQHLKFTFQLALPGTVTSSPGARRSSGGVLQWSTPLGQDTSLSASSQSLNDGVVHEIEAAAVLGLLVLLMVVMLTRRRAVRHRRRARGTSPKRGPVHGRRTPPGPPSRTVRRLP